MTTSSAEEYCLRNSYNAKSQILCLRWVNLSLFQTLKFTVNEWQTQHFITYCLLRFDWPIPSNLWHFSRGQNQSKEIQTLPTGTILPFYPSLFIVICSNTNSWTVCVVRLPKSFFLAFASIVCFTIKWTNLGHTERRGWWCWHSSKTTRFNKALSCALCYRTTSSATKESKLMETNCYNIYFFLCQEHKLMFWLESHAHNVPPT